MRKFLVLMTFAASLAAPTAVFADEQTPTTPAAPQVATATPPPSDEDKQVCRREHLTGTLFNGPMICKPAREWNVQHQDSADYINKQTTIDLQMVPPGH